MGVLANVLRRIQCDRWFVFLIFLTATVARAVGLSVLQQPAVSPDGKEVAFVTAGGIWMVPAVSALPRAPSNSAYFGSTLRARLFSQPWRFATTGN